MVLIFVIFIIFVNLANLLKFVNRLILSTIMIKLIKYGKTVGVMENLVFVNY